MPIVKHILSFGSGEISPLLDGRTDIAKYSGACKRLENFIPTPQGGLLKRPGLQRLGYVMQEDTDDSTTFGQLVEFQMTTHRSVVLALGGRRMKFVDKGKMVKVDKDSPTDFRIPIPWHDVDLRLLRWKQVNNVMFFCHPLYHPYQLIRNSTRSWRLEEVDFGLNVPLLDENTKRLKKITTKFNDRLSVPVWASGQNYEAGQLVDVRMNPDVTPAIHERWCARVDHTSNTANKPGQDAEYEDPDDGVDKPIWSSTWDDDSSEVDQRITLESTSRIFVPEHVGSVWEIAARRPESRYEVTLVAGATNNDGIFSNVLIVQGEWDFITFGSWSGKFVIQISTDRGETWTNHRQFRSRKDELRNASAEGDEDKRVLMRIHFLENADDMVPAINATTSSYARLSVRDGRIRGLVRITGYINPKEVRGRCLSPVEQTTTSVWREGAWSTHQGYPRCVELHQNRLLFAGTNRRPHTIWGSAVDDYLNFKRGTDADMSYVHTLAIGTRDPVLWMDSNRTLVVGNGGGEFTLRGENSDSPVTPEFGICDRHSSFGTHQGGAGHIVSDTVSLFVQNGGRALREMAYSFQSDKYESANLNLLADHLFKGPIQDVAVQRQPFQIIWVVAGGQLFSMTYERSQEVVAWARHTVGGEVIAIGSVRRYAEDGMFFLIRRGDKLAIERFTPGGILEPKDDGSFMDSHTTLDGAYGTYNLTGHPLKGKTVCGFYHGKNGMGGKALPARKLDAAFFKDLSGPVTVGLPFRALCQPVTPEVQLENGSSRSRECRIHKIVPNVHRSRGGKFGQTPDGPLDPLKVGNATHLYTGEVEREFDGGFSTKGDFCIISDEPHPFTIRSVALKLNYTGDVR